ncbi:DUF3226 domain-containing protein [Methylacidiphilum kamchatkense]|uniref:DUF3226 domain-containing protein n=1 Tax=Methylacidiphilum kamchatkense TaxID=431057 RepID=UPI0028BDEB69|nr:DUF3226 domain-containing protein [Methylacidiphilum kamchatkense]
MASNEGYPAVKIHLLPNCNEKGALETLCYSVLKEKNPEIDECIRKYAKCTNTFETWSIEQKDKAYVQCFIASTYPKDPNKSLRYYLEESDKNFNFNHAKLEPLVNVIRNSLEEARQQAD